MNDKVKKLIERTRLTKEKMKTINNEMPSEAKYGDVFVAIAQAQQDKIFNDPEVIKNMEVNDGKPNNI